MVGGGAGPFGALGFGKGHFLLLRRRFMGEGAAGSLGAALINCRFVLPRRLAYLEEGHFVLPLRCSCPGEEIPFAVVKILGS